ncbi:pyrroloquinoline quinone biosynthesis protein PqqB [Granulosicoccus antarcticus]|uniref:Coenzyme PQQ synthesis protein B n=1 Tax=Granulosicoccus antarcticus IMCC3135 TaxID=1192854 RepID=A0A2Z2P116_9GAMM|nr:pyrroloquinoline quinone biosynthesis protein PqqB [Granulosicoccus antarcticus]ASJ74910.1 Coenzyme PQQ synthesis protein B [Granulosicoccus antarcticus IMCC3135]
MFLKILGSAAGGGFPQWNCNCPMCSGVREGSINARVRTQSSIAVSSDRTDWVLFNASPDILTQIQQCGVLQPSRQLRDTGIQSIVLMDAQIDHTTGLLMLREHKQPLSIWCTAAVREDLSEGNPLFKVLSHYAGIDWQELSTDHADCQIPGAPGVTFTPLPLISNAPPYSPHRDQPVKGDTIGMLMNDSATQKSLFYAPGLGEMEPHVWQAMQKADVVLVDGTMWTDDEMIQRGASAKTARSMGHLPQSGPGGMLEWLDKLPTSTRKILIHINNTNPILDEDSEQRVVLDRHGVEVAYDGLEIEI